jgi:hypothetical protein
LDSRLIVYAFLWKETLLIKDEEQHEAWDHDQCCEDNHDQHGAQRAGRGSRC